MNKSIFLTNNVIKKAMPQYGKLIDPRLMSSRLYHVKYGVERTGGEAMSFKLVLRQAQILFFVFFICFLAFGPYLASLHIALKLLTMIFSTWLCLLIIGILKSGNQSGMLLGLAMSVVQALLLSTFVSLFNGIFGGLVLSFVLMPLASCLAIFSVIHSSLRGNDPDSKMMWMIFILSTIYLFTLWPISAYFFNVQMIPMTFIYVASLVFFGGLTLFLINTCQIDELTQIDLLTIYKAPKSLEVLATLSISSSPLTSHISLLLLHIEEMIDGGAYIDV